MITKALIEEVIDKNYCKVRIPIYHKLAGVSGSTPAKDLPIATICTVPGVQFAPHAGDVVFVDFELDQTDKPIILGYLSLNTIKSPGDIECQSLKVDINCDLPDSFYKSIDSYLYNTINGLQTQIDRFGVGNVLDGTLTAGSTSVTISDESIKSTSILEIYTDVYGVMPTTISVVTGSITMTFEAQSSDVGIRIEVR